MIGIFPIGTPRRDTISRARTYSTSTQIGAAYVKSRSRHVCGVTPFGTMSSSMHGFPTYTFVNRRYQFGSSSDTTRSFAFTIFFSSTLMKKLKLSMCCFTSPRTFRYAGISFHLSRSAFTGRSTVSGSSFSIASTSSVSSIPSCGSSFLTPSGIFFCDGVSCT